MAAGPKFSLFGIPIRIDPTFFVIAALLGFATRDLGFLVLWVAVMTVSLLVHELGHGLAFRAFGKRPQIVLQAMGGLTSAPGSLPPGKDILVSLAGPLSGMVLIGFPALWLRSGELAASPGWDRALGVIIFVNIAWSLVNLLPVLPLDGGRVTASALKLVLGERSDRTAHVVSAVVAAAAGAWALAQNDLFLAMFAAFFVAYNVSQLSQLRAGRRSEDVVAGYRALGRGDAAGALEVARPLLAANSGATVAQGMELQAWAELRQDRAEEAEAALERLPPGHPANHFLLGSIQVVGGRTEQGLNELVAGFEAEQFGPWSPTAAEVVAGAGLADPLVDRLIAAEGAGVAAVVHFQTHLYYAGRYRESARAGERAYAAGAPGRAHVAYDVACAMALAGRTDEALGWLSTAVDDGFSDRDLLDQDPDLESLRSDAGFRSLRARL